MLFRSGTYIFLDENNDQFEKRISGTKLPLSLEFITNFQNKNVFLNSKGNLKILNCLNVENHNENNSYILELENIKNTETPEKLKLKLKLEDIIIHPYRVQYEIGMGEDLKEDTLPLMEWLQANEINVHFYLKKPVNNIIVGNITAIKKDGISSNRGSNYKKETKKEDKAINQEKHRYDLEIKTRFNQIKSLNLTSLDFLSFKYETGTIEKKDESSIFSKLFYRTYQYLKPEKIKF